MAENSKKAQERAEIHKTIWATADELRGAVEGWDFKQFIIGTLFYRYLSENFANIVNKGEREAGDTDFDYSNMNDEEANNDKEFKESMLNDLGYFIAPSELFCNVEKLADTNNDLNITLHEIFKNIENSTIGKPSQKQFAGLFADIDVNSNKLGKTVEEKNNKLRKLLHKIAIMDLKSNFEDTTVDQFGDALEFLMSMYATQAGKSGGEFFTPPSVSELCAKATVIGKDKVTNVYDPTCGSGALLLKFKQILGLDKVLGGFYGQEINPTNYNTARMNMILHNVGYDKFDIAYGDTLLNPQHLHLLGMMDVVVSNPPYSIHWDGKKNILLINDERFSPAGVLAPQSNADFAFVMHILSMMSADGVAAVVCFPGIFYRGGAEQKIRKYLIENNYIDAIIELPPDLFFGTGITTDILILKKTKNNNDVLFINASKEFVRKSAKNELSSDNINNILQLLIDRENKEFISKVVSKEDIEKNNYDLSVNSYVDFEQAEEEIDIYEIHKELKEKERNVNRLRLLIDELVLELEGDNIE